MTKVISQDISVEQMRLNKIHKLFYNTKGVKKADEGKFKEASDWFTQAIELAPDDSMSYFNRATVQMQTGNIRAARSDFKLSESCRVLALS